jgi:hypothetical protein
MRAWQYKNLKPKLKPKIVFAGQRKRREEK